MVVSIVVIRLELWRGRPRVHFDFIAGQLDRGQSANRAQSVSGRYWREPGLISIELEGKGVHVG